MAYLISIICIALCLIGIYTERTILNPLTFFTGLWGIIIALSKMQLYRLHSTSLYIYWYILIGVISFSLGYYLVKKCRLKIKRKNFANIIVRKWEIRYRLLYIIGLLIILYQSRNAIIAIRLLWSGNNLGAIRRLAQDSASALYANTSRIENCFRIMFIMPFINVIIFISGIDFWLGNRNFRLLGLAMAICLTSLVTNGGRSILINFIISFMLSFSISKYNMIKTIHGSNLRKLLKKSKYIYKSLILVAILILILATLSRNGKEDSVGLLYYYFAMEPVLLEQWIETVNTTGLIGYGAASLNGFIFPLIYLIVNSFRLNYPVYWDSIYRLTLLTDSEWKVIAGGRKANAYVTAFWFLYLDGRIWGIIIGMITYGAVMGLFFNNIRKQNVGDLKVSSIFICLFISLFYSFARIQFTDMYYTLALVYILLFVFKSKRQSYNS